MGKKIATFPAVLFFGGRVKMLFGFLHDFKFLLHFRYQGVHLEEVGKHVLHLVGVTDNGNSGHHHMIIVNEI